MKMYEDLVSINLSLAIAKKYGTDIAVVLGYLEEYAPSESSMLTSEAAIITPKEALAALNNLMRARVVTRESEEGKTLYYLNHNYLSKLENLNKEEEQNIRRVFNHWCAVMAKQSNTALSQKRKTLIGKILKDYSFDDAIRAIDNCAKSPFHMGDNANGTKYNDINLIFRNPEKFENFLNCVASVTPINTNTPAPVSNFQDRVTSQAERVKQMIGGQQ